jgi:di/tricarboxylate transporter
MHRWMLRVWLSAYVFVAIQLGWLLRPFIGDPELPVQFVRPDAWDNAYVIVAKLVLRKFQGVSD